MNPKKAVIAYFKKQKQSSEEKGRKAHRESVGGLWDEIGQLQLEFLIESGLKPSHKLLDIGCGCLRGGVHYLKYLEAGNYHGLDINKPLIEAGKKEVEEAGLSYKKPNLIVDEQFSFGKFGAKFDFMVSISVFTHLPLNVIVRCLNRARESLSPQGIYYSTFFQAPTPSHLDPIHQKPEKLSQITTPTRITIR